MAISRHELSMDIDYVSSWGLVEGIRELYQNAIDEEINDTENKMFYEYSKEEQKLRIGNKNSILNASTLLLGKTSKRGSDSYIGYHGEGYKVGLLALFRSGYDVVIYNYGAKEIWRPKVVNSRKYKTKILAVDVEKQAFWKSVPDNNLVFEISNISEEDIEKLKRYNLNLVGDLGEVINVDNSQILLDPKYRGEIYVRGLYVCELKQFTKGFNLEPKLIKLDRDRKLVNEYQLIRETSYLIAKTNDLDLIEESLENKEGAMLEYVSVDSYTNTLINIADRFILKHGDDAIPVSTNTEMELAVAEGLKPVLVTETKKEALLRKTDKFKRERYDGGVLKISRKLEEWQERIATVLNEEEMKEYETIKSILKIKGL